MTCDCGSGAELNKCCGPLLARQTVAEHPEQLMRSRYTAYCHRDFDYIVATTDPQRRLDFDQSATRRWMDESEFTGLEVVRAEVDGNKGTVEFKATFKSGGDESVVHNEVARFRKQAGIWYFRPR